MNTKTIWFPIFFLLIIAITKISAEDDVAGSASMDVIRDKAAIQLYMKRVAEGGKPTLRLSASGPVLTEDMDPSVFLPKRAMGPEAQTPDYIDYGQMENRVKSLKEVVAAQKQYITALELKLKECEAKQPLN